MARRRLSILVGCVAAVALLLMLSWNDLPIVKRGAAVLAADTTSVCVSRCTRHGNCNEITSECECPFTHGGAACDEPLMPACELADGDTLNLSFLASEEAWLALRDISAIPGKDARRSSPPVIWLGAVPCACVLQAIEALSLRSSPMPPEWPSYIENPFLSMQRLPCLDVDASARTLWADGAASAAATFPWAYVPVFAFLKQFPAHSPMLLPSGLVDEEAYMHQPLEHGIDGEPLPRRAMHLRKQPVRVAPRRMALERLLPDLKVAPQLLPSARCGVQRCGGLGWCDGGVVHEEGIGGLPRCRCAATMMGRAALRELRERTVSPVAQRRSDNCSSVGHSADRHGPDRWRASSGHFEALRPCPNDCSGRSVAGVGGVCAYGFCHCRAGYWGVDCSSTASPALAARTKPRPRVHVYSLPPALRRSCNWWHLSESLGERLLRSAHVEADPSKADLFWIYGCPNGDTILPALQWIARTRPQWNASLAGNTAKHVLVSGHEEGWAEVWHNAQHWLRGEHADHENIRHRWDAVHPASPTRQLALVQLTGKSDYAAEGAPGPVKAVSAYAPCLVCFQTRKDVAVPAHPGLVDYPTAAECAAIAALRAFDTNTGGGDGVPRPRTGSPEVLFAGAVNTVPTGPGQYEPSRLVPYLCHKNASRRRGLDYTIVQSETNLQSVRSWEVEDRIDVLASARHAQYCLVPEGKAGGYGHRAIAYLLLGCVPVFTTERFSHALLDDAINWSAISLHVPPSDVPHLPKILARADGSALRRAAAGVRRRLLWASIYGPCHLRAHEGGGSDAFDTLMEVLATPRRHFERSAEHRAPRAPEARGSLAAWLRARGGGYCVGE